LGKALDSHIYHQEGKMKKYVLLVVLAVYTAFAWAKEEQQAIPGFLPALNPDLMSYFQEEMTNHMRYQMSRNYDVPFFLSFRFWAINKGFEENDEYVSNNNSYGNAFIEWQGKINDKLYFPLFAVYASGNSNGDADDGTLFIDNILMNESGHISETFNRFLLGGGLYFNGENVKGGVYAGYFLELHETDNWGYFTTAQWEDGERDCKDGAWRHSLKLALLPAFDTSSWKYIGVVLDTVLGYVGTGDAVDVYTSEDEDDKTAIAIFAALNYGLNFGFKQVEFKALSFIPRLFYKRDNYDMAARTDTYGAALKIPLPQITWSNKRFLRLSSKAEIGTEFGFKHFYSLSNYFQSWYPDTGFFSVSLSFSNFESNLSTKILEFRNISLTYSYDSVSKHSFALGIISPIGGAVIFEMGFGNEYTHSGGFGLRYVLDFVPWDEQY
jgi:hypothetical protein